MHMLKQTSLDQCLFPSVAKRTSFLFIVEDEVLPLSERASHRQILFMTTPCQAQRLQQQASITCLATYSHTSSSFSRCICLFPHSFILLCCERKWMSHHTST